MVKKKQMTFIICQQAAVSSKQDLFYKKNILNGRRRAQLCHKIAELIAVVITI